ncbi:MAG: hypothetical protein RLY71_3569 [Pseudomonadota bacterium]|jgi:hypothetical protein
MLDAFWRALVYCLHPRMIFLSLSPVIVVGSVVFGLAWFFWEPAAEAIRLGLDSSTLLAPLMAWLDQLTGGMFRAAIGPLVLVVLAVPVVLIAVLLLVSLFMGQAVVGMVARRRFSTLERVRAAPWWQSLSWSLGSTALALAALLVSLPLWLIPPLALLLPPLIWGWLTYRVMSFDALAEHATSVERRQLMRQHRMPLLVMGLVTGYLGAAPSLVWAIGVMALPMMPLLLPIFVWLYTLVFAFASLWFTHFCLAALQTLRAQALDVAARPVPAGAAGAALPVTEVTPLPPPAALPPPNLP